MREEFEKNGYVTVAFPDDLRKELLSHIEQSVRALGVDEKASLDAVAASIPDEVWQTKMERAFRIFPDQLGQKILQWADRVFTKEFGRSCATVNVVMPHEAKINPRLTPESLAIYWRYVRPGKPDAGRPHRDADFWDLEFKEDYDPKIPFSFDYLRDCMKIWIPLAGCYPDTTLNVVPRSHKMEIPTTVEQTEYGRRPSISSEWLKENQSRFLSPIELAQGSCILFDMKLVHFGPRHTRPSARISAELNFITK